MIPKRIHYCWFGRNAKPLMVEKCLKSWQKHCPDYEIIEWNEDNFDVSTAPLYVRQAYNAGKWAFVSDYVRLRAMTGMGGIYMDTDVELVKSFDAFLHHEAFAGFETEDHISTGVMACREGFPLFMEFLSSYDGRSFLKEDGSPDYTTNVETFTNICLAKGLQQNGKQQCICGLTLYPPAVFSPVDFETGKLHKTSKTVTIHWFSGSWYTEQEKLHRQQLRRKARREKYAKAGEQAAKGILGEDGFEVWAERFRRYRSWEEFSRLPRRIVRKLLGKSNAENE